MTDTRTALQRRSDSLLDADKAAMVRVVLPTRGLWSAGVVDGVWYVTPKAAADPDLARLPVPLADLP